MSKSDFNYRLTFHTDPPHTDNMDSQSRMLLSSKAIQALEEKEKDRCIARKDADPSSHIFDKIEATTFEIDDRFYQLIQIVQRRERVDLAEYHDSDAIQEEYEIFDSLKSTIGQRDALFEDLKKIHEFPKNNPPTVIMGRPAPHDPKDGQEPAAYFTQPALRVVESMMKEARFQVIQSELATIFDLMALQASRHSEIKQEEEMKIIALGLDLAVSDERYSLDKLWMGQGSYLVTQLPCLYDIARLTNALICRSATENWEKPSTCFRKL